MLRLQADSARAVDLFVERVTTAGTVWVLDDDGCVAGCRSNEQDADVFPVFSDEAYARRGAACWDDLYPPVSVPLATFTDKILAHHIAHGQLMGPNWDANMAGAEIEAGDLLERIVEAQRR